MISGPQGALPRHEDVLDSARIRGEPTRLRSPAKSFRDPGIPTPEEALSVLATEIEVATEPTA